MTDYTALLGDESFAIFLFHGVIQKQRHEVRNYTAKHIEAQRFAGILRELCDQGTPISLPDFVAASMTHKQLPVRSFAVTFDDGFENNFSVAAPILAEYKVPATFYITTGFIESNTPSWIDSIEVAVEQSQVVDFTTPFHTLSGTYETSQQKVALLDQIRMLVKGNPGLDPYEFAADFSDKVGLKNPQYDRELDEKMNWNQVCDLSKNPLFTIGGHGHTHKILEYLGDAELRSEISLSIEKLRLNLHAPTHHYSYPEGLAHCYSDRVIQVLQEHGVLCAPTAENGINHPGDDLFRLKRIAVT